MVVEGRCMRCKAKKVMKDAKMNKTSRGGFMAKGQCSECGCGMCAIMSKVNAEKAMADGDAEKAF